MPGRRENLFAKEVQVMCQKQVVYSTCLSVLILLALLVVPARAASFQGLEDLPGGIFLSHAYGVSSDGSTVVGRGNRTGLGGWQAYAQLRHGRLG